MASTKVSPVLQVLREIRREIQTNTGEIRKTNERVDHLSHRFDLLVEGQVRLASEVVSVAEAVGDVKDLLRRRLDDRTTIEDHEARLLDLERKVG
ncbi:MAG: hypothetical protein DRJ42_07675 [Deltaproteobacteria bacterium]|nr:MAG: hypothetical protein DRJ42_07675 [Deltaproteobacteria bacterium]